MKEIERQMTLADVSDDYERFVEKFKPKKTTDDCYTPDNVYEAVKGWACREYGIDESRIVRPFWPGGDYERFPYEDDSVVLDNPPFSIISKIVRFYESNSIPFFVFAPFLTNFSSNLSVSHVIQSCGIVYENGAEIDTSFLTNLDRCLARSAPELQEAIKRANDENRAKGKKQLPKYEYPPEVLTAASLGFMSKHGVDFRVMREDCFFVRQLDSQKEKGKMIFGAGYLLSERAAAERAAAERAAAERAAAEHWELSEREWEIVRSLGKPPKDAAESTKPR